MSVLLVGLADMGGHVLDDVAHVMVGERVEDLLALPLGTDEAGEVYLAVQGGAVLKVVG